MSDVYNANSNKLDEEQSEADQAMEIISGVANQQQGLSRYPNIVATNQLQEDEEGAFSHDSVVIESSGESRDSKKLGKIRIENEDVEEEPSNPRGFYYSFDYPVQLILKNSDDRQQRSVIAEEKSPQKSKNDGSELNSSLEAEVADYKIVKRSENSKGDAHILQKDIEKDDKVTLVKRTRVIPGTEEKDAEVKNNPEETPKESTGTTQLKSKTVEAQIPVYVKVESDDEPSDLLLKTEMELRRLASNEEAIDGVHDAQIHRRVQA